MAKKKVVVPKKSTLPSTVAAAFKKANVDIKLMPDVSMIPERHRAALIAVYKLFIVHEAINDGKEVDFRDASTWKYCPWMRPNSSGSGFSGAGYALTRTLSDVGSRLSSLSSEHALHIGKKFATLYKDFHLPFKK